MINTNIPPKDAVDNPVQEIIDFDYQESEMRVLTFYAENNNDIFDIPTCYMDIQNNLRYGHTK